MKQIGSQANVVWRYLETIGGQGCTFLELQKALGLSSRVLNMSLGWLLHEQRICLDDQGQRISLAVFPLF